MNDEPVTIDAPVRVVPANEATWEDIQTVFGVRGYAARCQCQYFKTPNKDFRSASVAEPAFRLRQQTDCGYPDSDTTSGLVGYRGAEPVGWCAVEPRSAYPRLKYARVPWSGREEDKDDVSVWAVTCFMVRVGFRRQGISRALARATVDFARERGARSLEAYPMIVHPGEELTWGELFVGSRSIFGDAGFTEVTKPTDRRVVMRIDF
jgi:GNAT superfamily N-acetyltransferase